MPPSTEEREREKRAHIFDPDKRNSKGFLSRVQSPGATELLVPGLMELEYAKMRVATPYSSPPSGDPAEF
ncbi:hypothetical protein K0M31_015164 [Melipona bicolor]|uniref:Uncharacterized protein n=1 Tax=Melipona bicolor TaxID=60889 RepID=A0AA40FG97_9HYME|nr:hypothetical protein K0M31_015164 [Melipona bicolor]